MMPSVRSQGKSLRGCSTFQVAASSAAKGRGGDAPAIEKLAGKAGTPTHATKTRIVDFEKASLEFLGFQLSWRKARSGKRYAHCVREPEKLRQTAGSHPGGNRPEHVVEETRSRHRARKPTGARMDRLLSPRPKRAGVPPRAKANARAPAALAVEETRQDASALRRGLPRCTPPRALRPDPLPHAEPMATPMKQPGEQPPGAGCGKSACPVR